MDFAYIVLFLAIYYLKPQEWTEVFKTVRFVQLTMIAALASLFMRARSLKLADFFRTPHDWAMYAFFGWVVIASPTPFDTFKEFSNRLVFYVIIVQTLTSWARIQRFLGWWTAMIVIVAGLAILGEYSPFDPLGSHDLTHGIMQNRLVLNLSMVNNPNALGHTIIPVLPMLYFFCIWKRPLFMKEIGLAAFILPLWAVYLTVSKGAYLAGAATILVTFTFGRPKIVQVLIIALAIGGGFTAVNLLPRMGELQKTKTDEAIQGRIKAFTYGREYYDHLSTGIGQGKFVDTLLKEHKYYKAAHSTYVQTGAELGQTGLFLFCLVIWTTMRTLMFAKTRNPEQERIRRILFVLVATYCISGWMVDFAYRATFFMFVAATGAFHRLLHNLQPEVAPEEVDEPRGYAPAWRVALIAEPAPAGVPAEVAMQVVPVDEKKPAPTRAMPWLSRDEAEEEPPPVEPGSFWNRISLVDAAVTFAFVYAVAWAWGYAIRNF